MRLLLDTHALIWWITDDPQLGRAARAAIADPAHAVLVSAASAWEIATKHRLGRLPEVQAVGLADDIRSAVAAEGFEALPITLADAERAGRLPEPVRDPFDRMLIAQALEHDLGLVSVEEPFDAYGITRIW